MLEVSLGTLVRLVRNLFKCPGNCYKLQLWRYIHDFIAVICAFSNLKTLPIRNIYLYIYICLVGVFLREGMGAFSEWVFLISYLSDWLSLRIEGTTEVLAHGQTDHYFSRHLPKTEILAFAVFRGNSPISKRQGSGTTNACSLIFASKQNTTNSHWFATLGSTLMAI